jgi:hypothetical protein
MSPVPIPMCTLTRCFLPASRKYNHFLLVTSARCVETKRYTHVACGSAFPSNREESSMANRLSSATETKPFQLLMNVRLIDELR